jgi:3-oxoacyl-[acyl-carrier-protein] synthase-3
MAAFAAAARAIEAGDHDCAVVVGSELVSRSLRAREGRRSGDTEFLRWTLSDGAGAVVLQNAPRQQGLSLRLDWTHLVSYAHERPVCMSAGGSPTAGNTWLDPVTPDVTLVQLRQEVAMLPDLFRTGVHEFARLIREGRVSPSKVDHLLCHYSAERFRGDIVGLLKAADLMIDEDRWFTNLQTRGNTGAASIFVMIEEAWHAGRFREGDRILLVVPESGRFSFAFAHLTCVAATGDAAATGTAGGGATTHTAAERADSGVTAGSTQRLVLDLAEVWEEFERRLRRTPIVHRIESGTASVEDYKRLLIHLRQQVVEGGRWISRAASNFSLQMFDFRSAAIKHAADEHKDYRLLERDYVAVGGDLSEIQNGRKNAGSEALSAFIFQQASLPDPVDLLGAMFIIEGLGNRLALGWAARLQEQLSLRDDQVSFIRYHAEADAEHIGELNHLLALVTAEQHERVVRTAQIVARLYALQLEEVN